MDHKPILESIEPEVVEQMVSRRDVLTSARHWGRSLAAAASVPVALGVTARAAFAQSGLPQSIVDVLNFALTLEELEAEFYRTGLAMTGFIPAEFRPVFEVISRDENAHVALLRSVLGAQAIAKPTFDFTGGGVYFNALTSFGTYVALSQAFEDLGVRAYKGQAANLMSNDAILTAALQIHSVEARHAAEVRLMRGQKGWIDGDQTDIGGAEAVYAGEGQGVQFGVTVATVASVPAYQVTAAFDEPLTMQQVLAIARPFIR